jgi:hypothetical protein
VFGYPPLAEKHCPTSHEAVQWLKRQALHHCRRAEFRAKGPADADREAILDLLCASDIPGSVSWIWDGGFYATIGEPTRAEKWSAGSAGEILDWLSQEALLKWPDSEFARQYAGFHPVPPPPT